MERGNYRQSSRHQENRESRQQRFKHSRSRSRSHEHQRNKYSSEQQKYERPPQQEERRQSRFGRKNEEINPYFQQDNQQQQQQSSRFSQRQERFQDHPERIQERQERFHDRGDRFQDRQDRFQDRNQNFQRQPKFQDQQQDNYQQRRGGDRGGGNRQQGRQQFNRGRGRNQQQQQQQQQQPPQKLYYYEQLQQVSEELLKNFEAQQAMQQQMASGELPIQQQQQQQGQQTGAGNMIENLNEIEKLKNEFDPQKSQEQFKEQIQETHNYKWEEWENQESEAFNAMDPELDKLLGKRLKVRIPPDIASNMGNINIQITKTEDQPEQQEEFKLTEKYEQLTELIEQLSPYQQQWQNLTSLLINEFELIDIYIKPENAQKKYSIPIVNYSQGQSKLGQVFTRDYFKLWEILFRFKLFDRFEGQPLQIANFQEGPGGFINCLVDYRNRQHMTSWKEDKYVAMTPKNTDKKNQQIFDWDYFKTKKYVSGLNQQGYTIKLTYGASQDGDMLNTQNLIFFINYELKDKATNQIQKCHVVTANGGVEFPLFNNQSQIEELSNAKLFFAEVAGALSIQAKGGFFIMKIFNTQYEITRNILTLLAKYYKRVFIVKPFVSNPVSNERYVVCDDFIGIDQNVNEKLLGVLQEWMESENQFDYEASEMFFNKFLEFDINNNSKFIENLKKSNEESIDAQIEKIKYSLNLLTNPVTPDIIKKIKENQFEQAKKWCIKFEVPYLFKLTF